jgi:hypothetical protein
MRQQSPHCWRDCEFQCPIKYSTFAFNSLVWLVQKTGPCSLQGVCGLESTLKEALLVEKNPPLCRIPISIRVMVPEVDLAGSGSY